MENRVDINNNNITWAIARAGYDLDEFIAKKFPKVQEWLNNTNKPTVKQLEDFSNKVHIPFGYLFLAEPPLEKLPIPFFRTGKQPATHISLNVYDTIMLLQRRQEWLSEYLKEEGFERLEFCGKYNIENNPLEIVNDIRRTLGLEENWASKHTTWEAAKAYLAAKIEEIGIIINFNSVVGNSNQRKIDVAECRGFVLVNEYAPFMFINADDGKAAQIFTFAHELAHIWTGKSAGFDLQQMLPADDPIEILCDQVAAEFLVPAAKFNEIWDEKESINFKNIAKYFKVSPIVIARRALDLGKIDKGYFFKFYHNYTQELKNKKDTQTSGGGDFFATQKFRLGMPFMAHLNRALKQQKVLYSDAYKLSGLKGDTFHNFIKQHNL